MASMSRDKEAVGAPCHAILVAPVVDEVGRVGRAEWGGGGGLVFPGSHRVNELVSASGSDFEVGLGAGRTEELGALWTVLGGIVFLANLALIRVGVLLLLSRSRVTVLDKVGRGGRRGVGADRVAAYGAGMLFLGGFFL